MVKMVETTESDGDDQKVVMAEIGETVRFKMLGKVSGEIKNLKRFVENPKQFAGYTLSTDEVQVRMRAYYFREQKKAQKEKKAENA